MITKKSKLTGGLIVLLGFVLSIYYYPKMPSEMAIRWGFSGEVNDYASKEFGMLFPPFLNLGLLIFFIYIPRFDRPDSDTVYELVTLGTLIFVLTVHYFVIQANL